MIIIQVQWEWQDDGKSWRPYGRVESKIIEVGCGCGLWVCSLFINSMLTWQEKRM